MTRLEPVMSLEVTEGRREFTATCPPARRRRGSATRLAWMLLVIPLLSIPLLAIPLLAGAASAVAPGDTAPDFTLYDLNGVPYTLSDYRGKVVLLALVGWG